MADVAKAADTVEDVTFGQLRVFACAARAGSFAKAADQLDISQPSISEQIKILERRLGRTLFHRRKGQTSALTEEGAEALELVETLLGTCNLLFRPEARPPTKTSVRISIGPYLREAYLKPLIPRIYRRFPEVEIEIRPMEWPAEAIQLTASGEIDLAVYEPADISEAALKGQRLCEFPMILVGPPGTRARLDAGECSLNDFQYIFPLRRAFGARWAHQRLRDIGLAPRITPLFVEFADLLADMVEEGQGLGYLMAHSVAGRMADGRLERLDITPAPMRRLIARSPRAPAAARAIEEMIYDTLAASNRAIVLSTAVKRTDAATSPA